MCITGFPPEAHPRELKNLCRFMQGFEGAHVAFAAAGITSLFVKFGSSDMAQCAIETLGGVSFDLDVPALTLKAEWARREMEVRQNSLPAPLVSGGANRGVARPAVGFPAPVAAYPVPVMGYPAAYPAAVMGGAPAHYGGPALTGGHAGYTQAVSASRTGSTGGELVTITILGITEKRLILEDLLSWFQQRPGFVALQVNERIDAIFARFVTSVFAEQAIHDANAMNFGAEWARRNLDDDLGQKNAVAANTFVAPAPAQYGGLNTPMGNSAGYGPAPPGPRGSDSLTTLTILGMRDKGLHSEEMKRWFTTQPGFVAMQENERIDGMFVKYTTQGQAQQVITEGNQRFGFGAEWARRNLDDDRGGAGGGGGGGGGSHGGGGGSFHQFAGAAVASLPQSYPPQGSFGPSKRQRVQTGELDTICILSMKEKGLTPSDVQQWFQELPGFVAMQVNERIDGLFVKFNTKEAAEKALSDSNARSLGSEWARRNLDL